MKRWMKRVEGVPLIQDQVSVLRAMHVLTVEDVRLGSQWFGYFGFNRMSERAGLSRGRTRNIVYQLENKGCLHREINDIFCLTELGKRVAESL